MRRESGYYWIKVAENRGWEVAYWDSYYDHWDLCGDSIPGENEFLLQIDERRIERKDKQNGIS
jgi:poly(3-hydroxybutyrate) depolymerase